MYTVYDRMYGHSPAKNTVYTPYMRMYVRFWPTLQMGHQITNQTRISGMSNMEPLAGLSTSIKGSFLDARIMACSLTLCFLVCFGVGLAKPCTSSVRTLLFCANDMSFLQDAFGEQNSRGQPFCKKPLT